MLSPRQMISSSRPASPLWTCYYDRSVVPRCTLRRSCGQSIGAPCTDVSNYSHDQTLWVSLSWRFLRVIGVKGLSGRFSPDDWLSHSTIKTDEWRQAGVLFMINNKCSPIHKMLIDTASSGFLTFQWLKSPLTERLHLRSGLKWVPKPFSNMKCILTHCPHRQYYMVGKTSYFVKLLPIQESLGFYLCLFCVGIYVNHTFRRRRDTHSRVRHTLLKARVEMTMIL